MQYTEGGIKRLHVGNTFGGVWGINRLHAGNTLGGRVTIYRLHAGNRSEIYGFVQAIHMWETGFMQAIHNCTCGKKEEDKQASRRQYTCGRGRINRLHACNTMGWGHGVGFI
jgi:hypothetical protein